MSTIKPPIFPTIVISDNYTLLPNSFSLVICYSTTPITITLHELSQQILHTYVEIYNRGNVSVQVYNQETMDTWTIPSRASIRVSIADDVTTLTPIINAGWGVYGNSLSSTGSFGTSNNMDFNIIANNITVMNINSTSVNIGEGIILNMNGDPIINVQTPVNPMDGANKQYVDNADNTRLSIYGGALLGPLNINNQRVINVPYPNNPQDAANKQYVDALTVGGYLQLVGGTMGGTIDMNSNPIINLSNPINPMDAVNMQSVEGALNNYLLLSGGTMSGEIIMGHNRIKDVRWPVDPRDAANKEYVEIHTSQHYLPLTGGGLTGVLNMNSNPIINVPDPNNPMDAANMEFVNNSLGNYLPLSGGTLNGLVNMNNNALINVPYPSNPEDAVNKQFVDNTVSNYLPLSGGILFGLLDMNNYQIINVQYSTNPQDAANVQFVENTVANYLPLAGGIMSGEIDMGSNRITKLDNPIHPHNATNKQYVDNEISNYLPLSGGGLNGVLNMNNHPIVNVPNPINIFDAVNKQYVDSISTGTGANYLEFNFINLPIGPGTQFYQWGNIIMRGNTTGIIRGLNNGDIQITSGSPFWGSTCVLSGVFLSTGGGGSIKTVIETYNAGIYTQTFNSYDGIARVLTNPYYATYTSTVDISNSNAAFHVGGTNGTVQLSKLILVKIEPSTSFAVL